MSAGTERSARIDACLAAWGFGRAKRSPLEGDASFRRYHRITGGPVPAMLMDAPPETGEDCRPFIRIAEHLAKLNLSAPRILAQSLDEGLLLLEDFGDDLYARVITAENERELYGAAVDTLVALRGPAPNAIARPYDARELQREADLLIDWYLPHATGAPLSEDARAEYRELWTAVWAHARSGPDVLVLRDYHAENLFWLPQRAGTAKVGLIDFQDALIGDPAYDLVSLLEDARRDVGESIARAMIERYVSGAGLEREDFIRAYDILAAQRNAKIIGIFARLFRRDSKPRYLKLIPRVMRHLKRDLERQPALQAIRSWMERHVPELRAPN